MPFRKENFIQNEFYHIYNRGNSKQYIFHDSEDYERFFQLLFISNSTQRFNIFDIRKQKLFLINIDRGQQIVAIGAYCLMPNHFHVLITPLIKEGISKFMQKVSTGYAMYYNQKYKRTGSLFEGKFKAQHIASDRYLKYIFSYIHINPISLIEPRWKEKGIKDKEKTLNYLNDYVYSSYREFLAISPNSPTVIDLKYFPDYFPTKKSFQKEIFSWILYREERLHDSG